jgi:hypothetical protein
MKDKSYLQLLLFTIAIPFFAISCSKDGNDEPAPLPYIVVEQSHYNVSAEAQTIEVHVRTNIDLEPVADQNGDKQSWISISNSPQHTDDMLTYKVMISSNTGGVQREGYVYFEPAPGISIPKDADIGNKAIIIEQAAANP